MKIEIVIYYVIMTIANGLRKEQMFPSTARGLPERSPIIILRNYFTVAREDALKFEALREIGYLQLEYFDQW